MSSNVGLSTPRGSGTSGYVQRNLSALRPRQQNGPSSSSYSDAPLHYQRQPDKAILAHDRAREIEARVFDLRDKLEDEGELDEEEIDERCDKLRWELTENDTGKEGMSKGRLKAHQVHELAEKKIEEQERLRRALGIGKDYVEGGHWERQRREKEIRENGGEAVEDEGGKGKREERSREERIRERSLERDVDRDERRSGGKRRFSDRDRSRSRSPGRRRKD